ncbi:MAG: hypothetical protein GWQ05_16985 [Verrucomicrobiaceae bacterium]|nr:hypothetical protein [Verrucomicrobiaceae bacterium]
MNRFLSAISLSMCLGLLPVAAQDELADFGIYAESAKTAKKVAPMETTLPLELKKGARVAFVGNTLLDRAQYHAYFETLLFQRYPQHDLVIRNFAWSADEVDLQPRPDNFATTAQHLTREKTDVIVSAFGFNESFGGLEKLPAFRERLRKWILEAKTSAYNGSTGPQIVLLSPIANEGSAGQRNNASLKAYTQAMREVAREEKIGFADLYADTAALFASKDKATWTINGVHLTGEGYAQVARILYREVFGETAPAINPEIREILVDKNRQYFRRYRPLNAFYYTGGRNKKYGYLDFLPAMRNFELLTANREARAWALARGGTPDPEIAEDKNLPPLESPLASRGANEWLSPADELKAFRVDPRFEVNLFASEEEFPEIACPVQMRWDAKGRLWVACSTTYPHVYPGQEPRDKIVILEDTDWDGKADKSTVWADDVHIPLSFVLTDDGVYVSEEPHLTLLRDTDGDDKADKREHVLTGFGTEDSHHALHDFVWTPDGDLLFREAIFHNSQVETAYGPVRAKNSAWFQFHPKTQRLTSFGNYPNTNPWGVTFDDWGYHVASHPIFASAFHATNPPYPKQHPNAKGLPAYSGVCGHEFVDFPMWPEDLQGGFIKVRYKPTNRVEIHRWVEHEDHFAEEYQGDLIFSENLSFIPVDLRYGPRGAMYVCDWYNPVKGHAQYSLRDPRRDRKSGRIWRIVPKGAALSDPPPIVGASESALLDILKRPEYRYRYWAKRELRKRGSKAVLASLDAWVKQLDVTDVRHRHHQVEALWLYRALDGLNESLLAEVLHCEQAHARSAATRLLRHWHDRLEGGGIGYLSSSAKDASALVRMEAGIAATYMGSRESLEAILPVLDQPMGDHLRYTMRCVLGAKSMVQHLEAVPALKERVASFQKKGSKLDPDKVAGAPRDAREAAFDNQRGLKQIKIGCLPERLLFTRDRFRVKAGQPVKLLFSNPDVTQHNIVFVEPGAEEEIGMAGNEMAKDPEAAKKGFIPKSSKILYHSRLLNQGEIQAMRFEAPEKPGRYPYLCTFPGHWVVMKGVMIVR